MGSGVSLNTGMGLVGGIPSDITIANNTFIDVNPRPEGSAIEARAHNAQGREGIPPIERLVITDNHFLRSGGPAIHLAGIQDGRIEGNHIESAVHATCIARPSDKIVRQAVKLQGCRNFEVRSNTFADPGNDLQPDATSGTALLGLSGTAAIKLDQKPIADAAAFPREPRSQ
jgi:hypothetical protein